jgi:hypothetical protein
VDHRADIYSLGVVFYEMLTGELPLGKFAPPSGKVQVDVRLDEVVLKALEKEPERRYQQASQVKTDVEKITRGTPQPKTPASSVFTGWKVALGAIGFVALVAVGILLLPPVHFPGSSQQKAPNSGVRAGENKQSTQKFETAFVTRGALAMVIMEAGRLTASPADPAQWQVHTDLPETSVVHIEIGQEVECQADAFPGRVFKGKVTRIDDAPKPGLQPARYGAVAQVTNPGLKFRDGMSVRLAFILAHRADALRIPVQALLVRLSGHATLSTDLPYGLSPNELAMPDAAERAERTVWILRGKNQPEPVQIRIGITDSAFTEVTSGLREGERVVIGEMPANSDAESDRQAELAPRKNSKTSGFGLVIERVLKAKQECFLDLDTGQTHGPAIIGGESDLPAGMDLSIPFTPVGAEFRADRVVALDHLEVQPATSADWDLSLNELSQRFKSFGSQVIGGSRAKELANQQSELPLTFLFRTSQWSEGVLQIVAFTREPPGVRLRYKFLPYGFPPRNPNQNAFGPARRLAAVWPDGISIELVGLSQYPSKGAKSWRTDGYELPSPPFDESSVDIRSYQPPGTRPVELIFSITGLKSGPGSDAEFDLSNAFGTGRKYKQGVLQSDIKAFGLQVPANALSLSVALAVDRADRIRMTFSLRTNVWLTDAASLLSAPLTSGERAAAFMYVSLRPGYATFPQVRFIETATMQNRIGMVTKIYVLKPGEAGRVLGSIKSMIGAAGEAVSDDRSNSITVSASPSLHECVAQLLQQSGALEQSGRLLKAGPND